MSDLIDRGRLKERLFPVVPDPRGVSKTEISLYMQGWNDAITSIIENEPSAEPKKGKWIIDTNDSELINCSCCRRSEWSECFEDIVKSFNYCPNCGAKMEAME